MNSHSFSGNTLHVLYTLWYKFVLISGPKQDSMNLLLTTFQKSSIPFRFSHEAMVLYDFFAIVIQADFEDVASKARNEWRVLSHKFSELFNILAKLIFFRLIKISG